MRTKQQQNETNRNLLKIVSRCWKNDDSVCDSEGIEILFDLQG